MSSLLFQNYPWYGAVQEKKRWKVFLYYYEIERSFSFVISALDELIYESMHTTENSVSWQVSLLKDFVYSRLNKLFSLKL